MSSECRRYSSPKAASSEAESRMSRASERSLSLSPTPSNWRIRANVYLVRAGGAAPPARTRRSASDQQPVVGHGHGDVGLCPEAVVAEGRRSSTVEVGLHLRPIRIVPEERADVEERLARLDN